jgi:hypothetical protein
MEVINGFNPQIALFGRLVCEFGEQCLGLHVQHRRINVLAKQVLVSLQGIFHFLIQRPVLGHLHPSAHYFGKLDQLLAQGYREFLEVEPHHLNRAIESNGSDKQDAGRGDERRL